MRLLVVVGAWPNAFHHFSTKKPQIYAEYAENLSFLTVGKAIATR